jgi:hypothetical protein
MPLSAVKQDERLESRPGHGHCCHEEESLAEGDDAEPDEVCGDWLLYRGIQVTDENPHYGTRLWHNGSPLQASLIQVAATNVRWHWWVDFGTGVLKRHIRRAVGDLRREPTWNQEFMWRFFGAASGAICLWQEAPLTSEYVVNSECKDQPNLVDLCASHDVFVQVNFPAFARFRGTFDLWVKVLA